MTAILALCGGGLGACGMLNGLDEYEPRETDRRTSSSTGPGGSGGLTTSGVGGMGSVGDQGGTGGTGGSECTGTDTTNCPPPSSECMIPICDSGTCGEMPAPAGTVTAVQTAGDCKQNECDADGNITSVNLDSDVENDNETCTTDTCNAGTPVHTPVALSTACSEGNGAFCNATGTCVECNNGGQCASGVCQGNACVAATCFDSVQNGSETGIDCGGADCYPCDPPCDPCPPCPPFPCQVCTPCT